MFCCFDTKVCPVHLYIFFFNDTATTEIYTLSLHDALPISQAARRAAVHPRGLDDAARGVRDPVREIGRAHAELQSQSNLVCRLLLEKKKVEPNRKGTRWEHDLQTVVTNQLLDPYREHLLQR